MLIEKEAKLRTWHIRMMIIWMVTLICGGTLLAEGTVAARGAGQILLLVGVIGFSWQARRLQDVQATFAYSEWAEVKRDRRRKARLEREAVRKQRQAAARGANIAQLAASAELLESAQQSEIHAKRERERKAFATVARQTELAAIWQLLTQDEERSRLSALLEQQNSEVSQVDERRWIIKNQRDNPILVSLCDARVKATIEDLNEALDQAKRYLADHLWLVAPAGFSPQAVRLSSRHSVTLVEAYTLADWEIRLEASPKS